MAFNKNKLYSDIKETVKEKWSSGVEWYNARYLSDVPDSRNWFKTVPNLYENSYICNFV